MHGCWRIYGLGLYAGLSCLNLWAQDSSLHFLKDRVQLDITTKAYWQNVPTHSEKEILLPSYIREKRSQYNGYFNNNWKYAKDNPLYHAAFNLGFHTKVDVGKGLYLLGSLYTEHRGFSYGVNTTNNILLFPQLKFYVDRKFKIRSREISLTGYVGSHNNPRIYEGLTLYNLYQQGYNYKIRYKKFQLQYFQVNDLLNGTGMFIDETYDAIASLEGLRLNSTWRCDMKLGTSVYYMEDVNDRQFYNLSMGAYIPGKLRLYGQMSYRNTYMEFSESDKMAGVVGITFEKKTKRMRWDNRLECRYYGSFYNAGMINYNVYYRHAGNVFGNTIGAHFYPVMLYDRPFSQWAVYAEYQDRNINRVGGISYTTNHRLKLHDELTLIQQYDINYIEASNGSRFVYPFATVSLAWEPLENNYLAVGITNKGMNLDMHYQTHYLFKYPSIMFSASRDLSGKWFGWE